MAKSGIQHADVGDDLSKAEWLSEESHALVHGNAFPDLPVECQLFYRDDEHKWYVYNGTAWTELTVIAHDSLTGVTADQHHPQAHTLASHSTKAHSELTGIGASDHHVKTGDNEVKGLVLVDTAVNRPAAAVAGRWFIASDTLAISYDTGTAWTTVGTLRGHDLEALSATWVTSGRFGLARMPDAASGFLEAAGAGADPLYNALVAGDIPNLDAAKTTTGRFGMPRMPDGTNAYVLTAKGAGLDPTYEAAAAGGVADFPKKLKPAVTRWAIPGWYCGGNVATTSLADTIFYIPIFVEETTTYIRIGCNVTTAAAGTADLRIFNWNDGVPGSLVLAAGTVDTGTTGAKQIVISQQLTRGYYFLAIRSTGAPAFRGPDLTSAISLPCAGMDNYLNPFPCYVVLYVTAAYADPAPAPTDFLSPAYAFVELREN